MSITGLAQHLKLLNVGRGRCSLRIVFTSPQRSHDSKKSFGQARAQSTDSTSHNPEPHRATSWLLRGSSVRVSTLFTALLALGAGATALGLCVT